MKANIYGQEVEIENGKMIMRIRTPFRKAGQFLKWHKNYGLQGLGLNQLLVQTAWKRDMKLEIRFRDDVFVVEPNEITTWCSQKKSFWRTKGQLLYVYPLKKLQGKVKPEWEWKAAEELLGGKK